MTLEWSFSCSEADYEGHGKFPISRKPHYHFQMRADDRPFIDYNDFHIPLSDYDIFQLGSQKTIPEEIRPRFLFGEGISDVLVDDAIEQIVNFSSRTDSGEDATFKFDTLMVADEGTTISGDQLYEIIQEAKEKGVSVASLAHKVENASVWTFVSPGPGVVEQEPRSGGRKKRPDPATE